MERVHRDQLEYLHNRPSLAFRFLPNEITLAHPLRASGGSVARLTKHPQTLDKLGDSSHFPSQLAELPTASSATQVAARNLRRVDSISVLHGGISPKHQTSMLLEILDTAAIPPQSCYLQQIRSSGGNLGKANTIGLSARSL
jgi:hypothetical protein